MEPNNEGKVLFQHDNFDISDSDISDDKTDLSLDKVMVIYKKYTPTS